jgi:hypothetical protein
LFGLQQDCLYNSPQAVAWECWSHPLQDGLLSKVTESGSDIKCDCNRITTSTHTPSLDTSTDLTLNLHSQDSQGEIKEERI